MKFNFLAIILALFLAISAKAQDDQLDSLDFEEQTYEQFDDESKNYIVFGGGAILNMVMINYDEINTFISSTKFDDGNNAFKLEGFLYQFGAQGVVTIGLVPNVRIGIIGMSGSISPTEPLKKTIVSQIDGSSVEVERNITLEAGYTGINIDYAIVPFKSFAIVPGINFGYGEINLLSTQTQKDLNWSELNPSNPGNNYKFDISTSYWHFAPTLNLEYAPTILSLFRVSVGYSMSFGRDWYLNGNSDTKIADVPDKLNTDGLGIQFGILLGLFNY